jgi:hypothetical protein
MAGAVALRRGKPTNAEWPTKIGEVDKGVQESCRSTDLKSFMERQTPHQSCPRDKGVIPKRGVEKGIPEEIRLTV